MLMVRNASLVDENTHEINTSSLRWQKWPAWGLVMR